MRYFVFLFFGFSSGVFAQSAIPDIMLRESHQMVNPLDPSERGTPYTSFDSYQGAKYGVLGNIGRPVIGGGSVKAEKFVLTPEEAGRYVDGDEERARFRNEVLGCSTIDVHSTITSSLNVNDDHTREYVDSPLGTMYLTTLLNSPQIAATIDHVEDFGVKRLNIIQDRCQAIQADASVSGEGMMRWQALQACVRKNVGEYLSTASVATSGAMRDKEEALAISVAYRACLFGSQGQKDSFGSGEVKAYGVSLSPASAVATSLEEALKDDVLVGDPSSTGVNMWTGTLFDALQNTAFCTVTGGGGRDVETSATTDQDCVLLGLIPNLRWCSGAERYERSCLNESKPRLSRATFNPQQVFDIIFAYSQVEIRYRNHYAQELAALLGRERAQAIAKEGELLRAPIAGDGEFSVSAEVTGVELPVNEMETFANCAASDGVVYPEDFNEYIPRAVEQFELKGMPLNMETVIGQGMTRHKLNEPISLQAAYDKLGSDFAPAPFELNIDAIIPNIDEVQAQVSSEIGSDQGYDIGGTGLGLMIMNATRCVMKHHARTTLMDHLKIASLDSDEERNAVLFALEISIAQTSTEFIYQFLKEKLLLAEMDLFNSGALSSSRATPPHIQKSMETLVKVVENHVTTLRNLRMRKEALSEIVGALY